MQEQSEQIERASNFRPGTVPGWLYVDLNCFFASAEQHLDPALRGHPVAVVPIMGRSASIIAASREAKKLGIKGGRVDEVRRLCPDIVFREARPDIYLGIHRQIIAVIERHLPVDTIYSIDDFICRLMANEASVERATAIARAIKADLRESLSPALTCSIGIAPNRYLAKVASDLQKPDGLTVLAAEAVPERLASLPLTDLPGIGARMGVRLAVAGLHSFPDLWRCDPKQLRAIWRSVEGERLWYRLRGYPVPDDYAAEGKMIGHGHVLPAEARLPENARPIARRLAQKAGSRLRRRDCVAGALDLSVRFVDGRRWSGSAALDAAHDVVALTRTVDALWQRMEAEGAISPQCRLKQVSVMLHQVQPVIEGWKGGQGELFAPVPAAPAARAKDRPEALSRALDALNQRFGQDAVKFGHLPVPTAPYVGAKIAFGRIPEDADFTT
jgi:DNA polymerase IV